MITRLAWLTTAAARGRDDDEPAALAALAAAGVQADVVDWDDEDVDWASYDRAVLRSTWDYPERLADFVDRLDVIDRATELVNPAAVVRWNLDKRYLTELAAAGVPTVPTEAVEPGGTPTWPDGEFVVKPAIGAGSRDAARYGPADRTAALEHVRRLHGRGATALVQPFLHSVDRDGEWPLVFLAGAFSHAASKRVRLPRAGSVEGLFAHEENVAYRADPAQIAVAQAALDVVTARFGPLRYARIDLVRTAAGGYAVLEVELIEPSLFLPQADAGAADRLAAALSAR
ncbi:ATP-grasp domain-containing protein [Pseudonocardia sp. CA-107938]|uniref:ATP-grasp domain-containing protein n=1 Tax=Pseudonocardia sp. CA-107938 TaxID=3240021 RepID=UPI003D93C75A